jgi:hypothetical protein
MQIREPKFKFGDKVYCKQYESSAIITGVSDYSFNKDKFFYNIEWEHDDYLDEIHEDLLEPYIEKPKTVWDLKEGEECYWLTLTGHTYNGIWDDSGLSIGIRDTGGCFLTRKEAECEIERRKVETEMLHLGGRREFKNGENNYYIVCDFDSSHFAICVFNNKSDGFAPMTIYFDSAKECRNAIETIGEDIIRKYIFGVNK